MTGEQKRTFTGHTRGIQSLVFSPDGRTLASGSWNGTIRLWEVATGEQKETLFAPRFYYLEPRVQSRWKHARQCG